MHAVADHNYNGGWTALHLAAEAGCCESARLLLLAKADPYAANDGGQTPLMITADEDVRQLLQEADAGNIDYLLIETSGVSDPVSTIKPLEAEYGP